MTDLKGYNKKTREACGMSQIPVAQYGLCLSLDELMRKVEEDWWLVPGIGIDDAGETPLFVGDVVEDDDGRLFEIGFAFDSKKPGGRNHFARYEMKCIASSSYKADHIEAGRFYSFEDWVNPTNLIRKVGNIFNDDVSPGWEHLPREKGGNSD